MKFKRQKKEVKVYEIGNYRNGNHGMQICKNDF